MIRASSFRSAFTLAELLVVIAILAIVGLCVMRATKGAIDRADVVRCMGNMRGIHLALANVVVEEGQWPQCPNELGDPGYDDWWMKKMAKYQIAEPNWLCPTMVRNNKEGQSSSSSGSNRTKLHYIPTQFDSRPSTPYKWKTQPWLIEVADMHGEGNLISFPDGTIIGANRFIGGQM
jgi:prepilin-type N-terminal cleavage/methylation domain-containing protein